MSRPPHATCLRCGRARRADNHHPTLCGHCSREPEHLIALGGGQWVREGLIYQWQPDPEPPVCGTERGYDRHRRHGEPACDDCRQGHRIHRQEQRREAA